MGMRGNFSSNKDTACASIRYAHSPCSHSGVTAGTDDASWTYMYHRSAGGGRGGRGGGETVRRNERNAGQHLVLHEVVSVVMWL